VLGAVTTAVWPAVAAPRTSPRPLILSVDGSAAVTAVFVAVLGWLFTETRDGSVLGLAERPTSSIQTWWPSIIAVTLRRTRAGPAAHAQPERPAPRARSSPGYPGGCPMRPRHFEAMVMSGVTGALRGLRTPAPLPPEPRDARKDRRDRRVAVTDVRNRP